MILPELRKRVKKAGRPPGTLMYTGTHKSAETHITVATYTPDKINIIHKAKIEDCLPEQKQAGQIWIHVQGLQNIALIQQIADLYQVHPLTVEDILNVGQRPKVEEFEKYEFITLKVFNWNPKKLRFSIDQVSILFGLDFLLSFQEANDSTLFSQIYERLNSGSNQRLRQQGCDYLAYRLIDTIVDYYFIVLEGLGNEVDKVEDKIITDPEPQNTRTIYKLKRQILLLRKSIWPLREVTSHLLQVEETLITPFTRIYLRDLYDHVVQAIDTIETFRDILSNMVDVYLSSVTNRMNEVMKTLTVIATIFIPMTFIASLYGMNFVNIPELHWHWGYYYVLGLMGTITVGMLLYFRSKKWF